MIKIEIIKILWSWRRSSVANKLEELEKVSERQKRKEKGIHKKKKVKHKNKDAGTGEEHNE